MDTGNNIFHNEMFISAFLAWFIAQLLKLLVHSILERKFEFYPIFNDGGMPSVHSALVSGLAASAALCYGLSSGIFAVSTVLAIVVMHDASGIRRQSGKHAEVINDIIEILKDESFPDPIMKLKEVLGHTPLQVFMGCLLGITVALLYHLIIA
jgi:acid phosphatase family membrane protein YuiD